MPAAAYPPNTFHLRYDPGAHHLLGCWPASANDAPMRQHYTDMLALARAHGNCRFWLLDMRARNWHTPAFGQWFGTAFARAAHASLRQSLFIAYLLSPTHQTLANTPGVQATQRGCAAHGVYPFFFDSETAAHEWLAHQQAHDVQGVGGEE